MDVQTRGGRVDLGLRTRPRTELVAFGKLMAALAMMKSRDHLIGFQVEVYEDATADVPLLVLAEVVGRFMRTPDTWRPDPGTLVAECEKVRLEKRRLNEFQPCEQCSAQGWVSREIHGVQRMVRCDCWKAHQQRIAALGAGDQPLALPAGQGGKRGDE